MDHFEFFEITDLFSKDCNNECFKYNRNIIEKALVDTSYENLDILAIKCFKHSILNNKIWLNATESDVCDVLAELLNF